MRDDHRGVDQRTLDASTEPLALLHEVGEPLEDDVEHAADLTGRDHLRVEAVEGLRMLGHRVGEGGTGFDVLGDVAEDRLQLARSLLRLEDLHRPEQRETRVLERRELTRERRHLLEVHLADRDREAAPLLLVLRHVLAGLLLAALELGLLDERREVALGLELRLGVGVVGGLDDPFLLLARGVDCFVLEGRHGLVFLILWFDAGRPRRPRSFDADDPAAVGTVMLAHSSAMVSRTTSSIVLWPS